MIKYTITSSETIEDSNGLYVPITITPDDFKKQSLNFKDKSRVHFTDTNNNELTFRREYWNLNRQQALFIVKLSYNNKLITSILQNQKINIIAKFDSKIDMSNGAETCLLQIAKDPSNNHVIDISGNSGYDASVLSWGHNATYGDYLIFNGQRIQITNTNGSSNTRTILMFFNHTSTRSEMLLGFYEYDVYPITEMAYNSCCNLYSSRFTTSTNTWYHLGAVMTGTGYMVGNKMYINGDNKPLSWTNNSGNGNAVFQNYITLGSWMNSTNYQLHGYEAQIYYFDRELLSGEIKLFYNVGNKTISVNKNYISSLPQSNYNYNYQYLQPNISTDKLTWSHYILNNVYIKNNKAILLNPANDGYITSPIIDLGYQPALITLNIEYTPFDEGIISLYRGSNTLPSLTPLGVITGSGNTLYNYYNTWNDVVPSDYVTISLYNVGNNTYRYVQYKIILRLIT